MADRTADNADLAVDELKRRARRRLVGAIVLALAAAVILPLLLEKDPKPLGDDVSVQIPPVDEGRFINRLTGRTGESKSASKSDSKALPKALPPKLDVAPTPPPSPVSAAPASPTAATAATPTPSATDVAAPKKSVAEAEQRVLGTKPGAKADAKGAPEAKADAKADAKSQTAVAAAAPAVVPAPPVADSVAPAPALPAKAESFAVQIAAFTDDKGASALAGKLKRAGYASTYTEPVETSRGTLWRVRVGGFATRTDAEATRAKLKTEGWNGLVVAAK